MKSLMEQYKQPTPDKWRKIGDTFLVLSVLLTPMVMQLPLTEHQMLWANFGVQATGVVGKLITNFFTE